MHELSNDTHVSHNVSPVRSSLRYRRMELSHHMKRIEVSCLRPERRRGVTLPDFRLKRLLRPSSVNLLSESCTQCHEGVRVILDQPTRQQKYSQFPHEAVLDAPQ